MIYTITLNPAIDNIIKIKDKLVSGRNNRIAKKYSDVGGKGTHVSIALSLLNEPNICTGITGKTNYSQLSLLLEKYGIKGHFQVVANQSVRQNFVITNTEGNSSYLITEYGFSLTKKVIDNLFDNELLEMGKDDYAVISGNPSLNTNMTTFKYFLKKLQDSQAKIIADVSGKFLAEILKTKVFLIKPNEFEFSEIVSKKVHTSDECLKAYKENKKLLENVTNLAITLGNRGSILIANGRAYYLNPAQITTVNDTGSGDAYLSGLIYGFVRKMSLHRTGVLATALGAAKAEKNSSSGFDVNRVKELINEIEYKRIG